MSDSEVSVLIGTGAIGLAVARRVAMGKQVLLADLNEKNALAAAKVLKQDGFEFSTAQVDVTSRESLEHLAKKASNMGRVKQVVVATGVSPSHAAPEIILKVDLLGVALVLDIFYDVIAEGGAALVIGSQAGHRLEHLGEKQNKLLAQTPADQLLDLDIFHSNKISDPLYTYQLAKRASSLRVQNEALRWSQKNARVNAISPGIVMTPLSEAEFESENSKQYKQMIEQCPSKRTGEPQEVAALASVIMGNEGGFITGSDFLIDGGVTAAYWLGSLGAIK